MKGWKTWAAAIGTILTGLGMIAGGLSKEGGLSFENVQAGILTVTGGLGLIGIGHKLDKTAGQ